jgi:hypothetical protein
MGVDIIEALECENRQLKAGICLVEGRQRGGDSEVATTRSIVTVVSQSVLQSVQSNKFYSSVSQFYSQFSQTNSTAQSVQF